ncbi:beta-glucosidase [Sphingomonas guangdongensis]|uniref:Beta-glucosidase n=1 Tax=Sphingomonas guangdongensis TaxID=1141890 RepID=A0A285QWN8_9SPHN|nr:beta-glucosidase [Sphingomonas guangdongensis]SOB86385.1 beta-glucosidase [Sphingomonas guangdongensis]
MRRAAMLLAAAAMITGATGGFGQERRAPAASAGERPWMNTALTAEQRVALLLPRMTADEKVTLMLGYFGTDFPPRQFKAPAEARAGSAGYVPGVPRLGIPPQWQTDAAIGVATQGGAARKRERTALPSNLGVAASWDPEVAFKGGQMIGAEARASGFNVMLAGGVNLEREPRNGRNFEYGGEDPLLAGVMTGAAVAGIQANHIISTVKHFAINDQETDRNNGNVVIDHDAARMSDLLAFEIAIERGRPGSVMCAYNRVDTIFSCESPWLLTDVLRRDWQWPGYVMSDWGATHSTGAALKAGQDQQSGYPFDKDEFFGKDLKAALAAGQVGIDLVDRAVGRILFAMFEHGLFDHPITAAPMDLPGDMLAANGAVTRAAAADSIVLLKNRGNVLPLAASAKRIVIIGGHADKGVLAGGGSSLVYPVGGNAVPDAEPKIWPGPKMYYPNSPMEALKRRLPGAQISYVDGADPAAAAAAARGADVAVVFGTQWASESIDVALTLDEKADALIDQVAGANRNTVVVLETNSAVLTPWREKAAAIVAAWFPGTQGGEAIADVLTGAVNPSGHLPVTFIDAVTQLPQPQPPQKGEFRYPEGALVGYRWHEAKRNKPAFAFGHGLSYTSFRYDQLSAQANGTSITARFRITNTGARAGKDVAQIYVSGPGISEPKRLGGFTKVEVAPGVSRTVSVPVDPRLLATFREAGGGWQVAGGSYQLHLARAADDVVASAPVTIAAARLPMRR